MASKPKILCLHGFGESGELLRIRSRNFHRVLEDHTDLVYLDGHLDIANLHLTAADLDRDNSTHVDFKNLAWWWSRKSKTVEYRGLEQSLEQVGRVLNEQGPFDGILGFSQGACLAIIIAALLGGRAEHGPGFGIEVTHPPIKFLVLAGAFLLSEPGYKYLYAEKINVPSFHMSGEYDTVIPRDEARAASSIFESPVLFDFVGGHFIPQTPQCASAMAAFVAPFVPGVLGDSADDSVADAAADTDAADSASPEQQILQDVSA
ncbi:hypothetical protein H4217_001587 [Coemansia sp. RSA 1939]|nr:hypothetical protein H4217_001587 [Coemansia sp. RSA 1939]KAJ2615697.1 hypothetical protein EV177_001446 [Coemansia sp. RSA 1804]KAJ2693361.1 hypothetical protein GGH99_001192 [Coemansia sp. RSA 1285]